MSCDPAASVLPPPTALKGLERKLLSRMLGKVVVFFFALEMPSVFLICFKIAKVLLKEEMSSNSLCFSSYFSISVQLVKPFECFCLCIYEFVTFSFLQACILLVSHNKYRIFYASVFYLFI